MGMSTDAMLLYGYHLDGQGEWLVEGADAYGELPPLPWYKPDNEEEDVAQQAMNHLLVRLAHFTETDWSVEGYFDRKRAAEQRLGVQLVGHCSGEFPMWVLCAERIRVRRGQAYGIDPIQLDNQAIENGYDDKLDAAVAALGIQPLQERPMWLLCSYWG